MIWESIIKNIKINVVGRGTEASGNWVLPRISGPSDQDIPLLT